ncbi:MAG: hypothetical protein GY925_02490 [Actinomycetia bacterium]|nr:hypothetical protein [Actinomycetes bacterium]
MSAQDEDHRPVPTAPTEFLEGYWMLDTDGTVYGFGDATNLGDTTLSEPVALVPTPTGGGYWVVAANGGVDGKGDALSVGQGVNDFPDGQSVTSASATPSGEGLWLFTDGGVVVALGDAGFFGDLSDIALDGPIVASAATPTGNGYIMAASDGGVFAFGDAQFRGSVPGVLPPGVRVDQPIVGISPTPANLGYWLVAADGGMFAFGDAPFRGSLPGILPPHTQLVSPVNGMVPYGAGYLMVAGDGGIFSFSDLAFLGSLGANPPPTPIVGVASVPTRTQAFSMPRSGGVVPLSISGLEGAELWASTTALTGDTRISVWTTPGPANVTELLDEDPLFAAALSDAVEQNGGDPLFGPFITNSFVLTGRRIHLGPKLGTLLREPIELRIPLSTLGLDEDDLVLALLSDGRGTQGAPSRIVDGVLRVDIAHFSFVDIVSDAASALTNGARRLGRIGGNIWNNPTASPGSSFGPALTTINNGPLMAGLEPIYDAVCTRDDLVFDSSVKPKLWDLLLNLGFAHQVAASGGFKGGAAETKALANMVRARYDHATEGPKNGVHVTLSEMFDWALDIMDGDVYQALALSHDMLSVNRNSGPVQSSLQDVRGDGKDESGGRYHVLGAAVYSFMATHAVDQNKSGFFDVDADTSVTLEEAWYSGDIRGDTEEYVLDLKGVELGRRLYDLWQARSGQGTYEQRDEFEAFCGESPPGALRVTMVEPVDDPIAGKASTFRFDIEGGYVPRPPTGTGSYRLTVENATRQTTIGAANVAYAGGDEVRQFIDITFPEPGRYSVRATVTDGAGGQRSDFTIVTVVEPPPIECERAADVTECPDVDPITVTRTAGDWSIWRVETRSRSTAVCGTAPSYLATYTVHHTEIYWKRPESSLVADEATRSEFADKMGKWNLSTCFQVGVTDVWTITPVERGANEAWIDQRWNQIHERLTEQGYTRTNSRAVGLWSELSGHGQTGTITVADIIADKQ